jgi:uncharacterized protein with LGFP repeats
MPCSVRTRSPLPAETIGLIRDMAARARRQPRVGDPDLSTGAHEVHGEILGVYSANAWLVYPTTDGTAAPDGVGRYNHFQLGSIYWTPHPMRTRSTA